MRKTAEFVQHKTAHQDSFLQQQLAANAMINSNNTTPSTTQEDQLKQLEQVDECATAPSSSLAMMDKEEFFDMHDMLQIDDIADYANRQSISDINNKNSLSNSVSTATTSTSSHHQHHHAQKPQSDEEVLISSWLCRPDEPREGLDIHLWEQLLSISEKFSKSNSNKPQDLQSVKSILRSKEAQIDFTKPVQTSPVVATVSTPTSSTMTSKKAAARKATPLTKMANAKKLPCTKVPAAQRETSVEQQTASKRQKVATNEVDMALTMEKAITAALSTASNATTQGQEVSAEQFLQRHISSFQPCASQQHEIHTYRQLLQSNVAAAIAQPVVQVVHQQQHQQVYNINLPNAQVTTTCTTAVSSDVIYNATEFFNEATWSDDQ